MAKTKKLAQKVAGNGATGRMTRQPRVSNTSEQSSIIRYSAVTGSFGYDDGFRLLGRTYVGGLTVLGGMGTEANINFAGPVNSAGVRVAGCYSTYKFLPGSKVEWIPNVGFTTSGRIYIGFTDNPEVIGAMNFLAQEYMGAPETSKALAYGNAVKLLGNVKSYQVFERFTLPIPTRLRRKRFSNNTAMDGLSSAVHDKSTQLAMFAFVEGVPNGSIGSFQYHDVLDVEGMRSPALT